MNTRFTLTKIVAPVLVMAASISFMSGIAQAQETATGKPDAQKVPLMSGAIKKTGRLVYLTGPTTINNRVDSNAILNLDAKPMDPAPAAVAVAPVAPVAPVAVAAPTVAELRAKLKEANVRYKAAKADYKVAVQSKDKTRVTATKQNVASVQAEIKVLNKEIASANKGTVAVKKSKKKAAKIAVAK